MATTCGDSTELKVPEGLFKDVKYYLIGNLDEKIHKLLKDGGAKRDTYLSEMVSHAIADNKDHDDYSEAVELFEVPVVSPSWIVMCVKCECILPTNAFNLENYDVFSGVVACPSQIPEADLQPLWAMITFYGGQCQRELNRRCTHLITIKPAGAKYDFALQKPDQLKIITPDWVNDSVDKKTKQDEIIYHPKLLKLEEPQPDIEPDSDSGETIVDAGVGSPHTPTTAPMDDELIHTPLAKEALSKMVHERMQAAGRVAETPEARQYPTTPNLPMFNTGTETPRGMLRNITNSHEQPKSPARMGQNKVNQLLQSLGKNGRQQPLPEPPLMYFGHEPSETVPPDLCLLGCVFYITDYKKYLDEKQIVTWQKVIEQHGGQVDQAYSNRITHLLCENQRSDIFQLALKDGKRVVTAHWLNDCLIKQKMLSPWHALHVPSIYGDHRPCANQIICVTNFEGDERTKVKHMVTVIGAKYTGYMTHKNSALVCKKLGGLKYEKAKEWRIPVVNVAWLSDLVLGNLDALRIPVNNRYHQFGLEDDFKIDNSKLTKLLVGWRSPLKITKDLIKKFQPSLLLKKPEDIKPDTDTAKRKLEDTERGEQQPSKRARLTPTLEVENESDKSVEEPINDEGKPRIMITGIRKDLVPDIVEKIEKLGGKIVNHSREVTHLVASALSRTMKFFTTIPICQHVVTPAWVEDSVKEGRFVDEEQYALKDTKNEETFGIKLSESMARARRVPLFKEVRFYITPSTEPGVGPLKEIIENAGGSVVSRRSPARVIATQKTSQGRPSFIVIGCENDLHILGDMFDKQVTVYNAEFILTGVLKQELEYDLFHLRV